MYFKKILYSSTLPLLQQMSLFKNNHNTFTPWAWSLWEIAAPACLIPGKLSEVQLSGDGPHLSTCVKYPFQPRLWTLGVNATQKLVSVTLMALPLLQGSEHKRLPKVNTKLLEVSLWTGTKCISHSVFICMCHQLARSISFVSIHGWQKKKKKAHLI